MAVSKSIPKEISIEDIIITRNFRKKLDQAWVEQLAQLYVNNVDVDPITVTPFGEEKPGKYKLVKGRHRIQGRQLADFKNIKCHIRTYDSEADMIIDAISEDVKASKPMTHEDFLHTARQLYEVTGYKKREIVTRLSEVMPKKMAQNYADIVVQKHKERQMAKALDAMGTQKLNISEASTQFGVDENQLALFLKDRKGVKRKKHYSIRNFKGNIKQRFTAYNKAVMKNIDDAFAGYENNDFNETEVQAILDFIESNGQDFLKTVAEKRKRFKTLSGQ